MRAHSLLILSATLAAASFPALAQNQVQPNRAEQAIQSNNQSLETRSQIRSIQQQNQFRSDQLRGEVQRQQSLPPAPLPPLGRVR